MGKSHTYKYQIGKFYIINGIDYLAEFSSTDKSKVLRYAMKFYNAKIKKDYSQYVVLVPTSDFPSMSIANLTEGFKLNRKKLGLRF
jgi:hypothetical protein